MRWLLISTPITTALSAYVLHDFGASGFMLFFATMVIQLALGAGLARLTGRDGQLGFAWAALGFFLTLVIAFVILLFTFPNLET